MKGRKNDNQREILLTVESARNLTSIVQMARWPAEEALARATAELEQAKHFANNRDYACNMAEAGVRLAQQRLRDVKELRVALERLGCDRRMRRLNLTGMTGDARAPADKEAIAVANAAKLAAQYGR